MKKTFGLLIFCTLNASAYEPSSAAIRNFVNYGLIGGITEYLDIYVGEGPKKIKPRLHVYCRECPTDIGRQCQQYQVQDGDSVINLIPGDAQLIDDKTIVLCKKQNR